MARRRTGRGLGSSAATHRAEATKASGQIDHLAALTTNKARNGKCTAATMAYADMQREIGKYEAHVASGGQGVYKPSTAIQNAAYDYNAHCVREDSGLSGRKRRR